MDASKWENRKVCGWRGASNDRDSRPLGRKERTGNSRLNGPWSKRPQKGGLELEHYQCKKDKKAKKTKSPGHGGGKYRKRESILGENWRDEALQCTGGQTPRMGGAQGEMARKGGKGMRQRRKERILVRDGKKEKIGREDGKGGRPMKKTKKKSSKRNFSAPRCRLEQTGGQKDERPGH